MGVLTTKVFLFLMFKKVAVDCNHLYKARGETFRSTVASEREETI